MSLQLEVDPATPNARSAVEIVSPSPRLSDEPGFQGLQPTAYSTIWSNFGGCTAAAAITRSGCGSWNSARWPCTRTDFTQLRIRTCTNCTGVPD